MDTRIIKQAAILFEDYLKCGQRNFSSTRFFKSHLNICLERYQKQPNEESKSRNTNKKSLMIYRSFSFPAIEINKQGQDQGNKIKNLMHTGMENLRNGIKLIRHVDLGPNTETEYTIGKSKRVGIICLKRGVTHLWDIWGRQMPVTVMELMKCIVVNTVKHLNQKDGLIVVNIATVPAKNPNNMAPVKKNQYLRWSSEPMRYNASFSVTPGGWLPAGFEIPVTHLVPGQYVSVRAKTVSKGFQGVMKRWGFKGMPAGHGVRYVKRHGGSIGSSTNPGRVIKGKKMPGHMGNKFLTMHNQVVKIDPINNLIYLRGFTPGPSNRPAILSDCTIRSWTSKLFPEGSIIPFPSVPSDLEGLENEILMPNKCHKPDPSLKQ